MAEWKERWFLYEHEKIGEPKICNDSNIENKKRNELIYEYHQIKETCWEQCKKDRTRLWKNFYENTFKTQDVSKQEQIEKSLVRFGVSEDLLRTSKDRLVFIQIDSKWSDTVTHSFWKSSWVRFNQDTVFTSWHSIAAILPQNKDITEEELERIVIFDSLGSRMKVIDLSYSASDDAAVLKLENSYWIDVFSQLEWSDSIDIINIWPIISSWISDDSEDSKKLWNNIDVFDSMSLTLNEQFNLYNLSWFIEPWDSGGGMYFSEESTSKILWVISGVWCDSKSTWVVPIQTFLDLHNRMKR